MDRSNYHDEKPYGTNPLLPDANEDPDQDGFTNVDEFAEGSNPNDAASPGAAEGLLINGDFSQPVIGSGSRAEESPPINWDYWSSAEVPGWTTNLGIISNFKPSNPKTHVASTAN